jgi:molybdopterin adenylyltransferase
MEFALARAEIAGREVLGDDRELIAERLRHWADEEGCNLVLTTGGTGSTPNDVTPEATRAVIDREAPGIPEAMRGGVAPAYRPLDALASGCRHP